MNKLLQHYTGERNLSIQVSGGLLQTAQTWANARVCSASCAHALGSMFVCLFVIACLFYRQFRGLGVLKGRFMIAA